MRSTTNGFTLIEIIVVVAIVTILAGLSLPVFTYFQTFSVLDSAEQEVIQNIRYTQSKAASGQENSNFGIYINSTQYVIYKGDSYETRDASEDKLFSVPNNTILSGLVDVNFEQGTGIPSTNGYIAVTHVMSGSYETISINEAGLIQ